MKLFGKKFFPALFIVLAINLLVIAVFLRSKTSLIRQPKLEEFEIKIVQSSPTPPLVPNKLSLEKIFKDKEQISTPSIITLIATGDVGLVRSVNYQILKNKDFNFPFLYTADLLESADITVINLEGPLVDNCPTTSEGMTFCGGKDNVLGLKSAGIDIATFANNHIFDYGLDGYTQTISSLEGQNITAVTSEHEKIIQVENTKFAFFAFNAVGVILNEKEIQKRISQIKKQADIIVVAYHWGVEYTHDPTNYQIDLAQKSIDWGADLILGNHPHWVGPLQIYKDKLIAYSHGNFIFDQMWSQKTKEGVLGKYYFYKNKITKVEFVPIVIENYGQARIAEGDRKEKIIEDMKSASERLEKRLKDKD